MLFSLEWMGYPPLVHTQPSGGDSFAISNPLLPGGMNALRYFFRSSAISRVGRSRKSARSAKTSVIATIRPSVLLP